MAESGNPRDRRRVTIIVPRLAIGGTEQHLLDIAPKLDRRRFAVTMLTTRADGPLDERFRERGITVLCAAAGDGRRRSILRSLIGTARLLRRERPDVVHFFLPEAYLIGGLCAVLLGIRPRVMSRRSLNLYHRRRRFSALAERWLHGRMDLVLANSTAVANELKSEGVPEERLRTVYSGIEVDDYDAIDRPTARRELGLAEDSVAITCVANLLPYKGHDDLLAALKIAASDLPAGWTLLVVGRDEGDGEALRRHARDFGLDRNIRWMGERTDVATILRASDIAVLASHEEGMPKSILEAMAAGLPTIATNVGGTPEAVVDNETGLIVSAQDRCALANALIELATDEPRRRRFGLAARRRVDQLFRMETCVSQYEQIYETLLAGSLQRPASEALEARSG